MGFSAKGVEDVVDGDRDGYGDELSLSRCGSIFAEKNLTKDLGFFSTTIL